MFLEGILAHVVGSDGRDGRGVDESLFWSLSGHACYCS